MTVRILCSAFALGAIACGSPTAPASPEQNTLGRQIETSAFTFRFSADDSVDVAWQEAYHQWAIAALGVTVPRRIVYNKYLNRAHMGTQTGTANANAYADPDRFEIHTIWSRDNHEVVHLYSLSWGRPVALWTEGLAVAYQVDPVGGDVEPRWNRILLHDHARQFLAEGRLIPLADLLTTRGFRQFDPNVTYPQAGSFMRFVIEICGLDGVKRLYGTGHVDDGAASVRDQFAGACGRTVDQVEAAWHEMLVR